MRFTAEKFVAESNLIEGIDRDPTEEEVSEFRRIMMLDSLMLVDLQRFVSIYQPSARLRSERGMDVRVGNHIAPSGGPQILAMIANLLGDVNAGKIDAYRAHVEYETIHPFTDCNGRSGRMLWAWMMQEHTYALGFLHMFYYQALQGSRRTA